MIFLEIIKKVSDQNSRLIIFNKSFLYLTINSFFSKKKFNWLNANELKTYLENFNFLFIRKLVLNQMTKSLIYLSIK